MVLWHRNARTRPKGRRDGRGKEGEQRLSCDRSTQSWPRGGLPLAEALRLCGFTLSLVSLTGRMEVHIHPLTWLALRVLGLLDQRHAHWGLHSLMGSVRQEGSFRMYPWAQHMQVAAIIVTMHHTWKQSALTAQAPRPGCPLHTPSLTLEKHPSPGSTQGAHILSGAWARHCCSAPGRTTHRDRGGREKGPRMHGAGQAH